MLIVCKTCASSYHIPREILGETGCQLRCVGCGDSAAHFGLSTIQAIVAQYGGTVTEDRGEGTALVSILIPEAR